MHIPLNKETITERVLVCGDPKRAELLSKLLKNPKKTGENREYHAFAGLAEKCPVTIISHGVGSAGAAICFRELIDLGAKTIIRLGTAGGFYADLAIGDLFVPYAAVRKDGVSSQTIPVEYPAVADPTLYQELLAATKDRQERTRGGIVLTGDTFYTGFVDTQLELYSRAGVGAVEMECATLFVIGQLFGARTGAVLALDGNPLKWKDGVYDPNATAMKTAIERGAQAILEVFSNDFNRKR